MENKGGEKQMSKQKSNCPICDGQINLAKDTEESEIINCPECNNRVVVASINKTRVTLEKAPEIEEDWGQ